MSSTASYPATSSPVAPVSGAAHLAPLEVEVIDLFVSALRLIGLPRSLGEIYGLLFISPVPLSFDDLVTRLQISKGSVSQGLRTLRQIGAVKVVYVPGDRRDHYVPEDELKKLVNGFITGQVMPHLTTGQERLARLRELEKESGETLTPLQRERLRRLGTWHKRARALAPLVEKFIG